MFSTTLGFPKGKRATDHCSILALKAMGFSQELLQPRTQFNRRCMNCTQRNIFTNTKLVTLYVRKTLHEKMAPLAKNFRFFLRLTQKLFRYELKCVVCVAMEGEGEEGVSCCDKLCMCQILCVSLYVCVCVFKYNSLISSSTTKN